MLANSLHRFEFQTRSTKTVSTWNIDPVSKALLSECTMDTAIKAMKYTFCTYINKTSTQVRSPDRVYDATKELMSGIYQEQKPVTYRVSVTIHSAGRKQRRMFSFAEQSGDVNLRRALWNWQRNVTYCVLFFMFTITSVSFSRNSRCLWRNSRLRIVFVVVNYKKKRASLLFYLCLYS